MNFFVLKVSMIAERFGTKYERPAISGHLEKNHPGVVSVVGSSIKPPVKRPLWRRFSLSGKCCGIFLLFLYQVWFWNCLIVNFNLWTIGCRSLKIHKQIISLKHPNFLTFILDLGQVLRYNTGRIAPKLAFFKAINYSNSIINM